MAESATGTGNSGSSAEAAPTGTIGGGGAPDAAEACSTNAAYLVGRKRERVSPEPEADYLSTTGYLIGEFEDVYNPKYGGFTPEELEAVLGVKPITDDSKTDDDVEAEIHSTEAYLMEGDDVDMEPDVVSLLDQQLSRSEDDSKGDYQSSNIVCAR